MILGCSALGVVDGDLVDAGVGGRGISVGSEPLCTCSSVSPSSDASDSFCTCSSASASSDASDDASESFRTRSSVSSSSDTSDDDTSDSSSSDSDSDGTSDKNDSASSCNSALPVAPSPTTSPSSSAETFTNDELVEDDTDSKDGS